MTEETYKKAKALHYELDEIRQFYKDLCISSEDIVEEVAIKYNYVDSSHYCEFRVKSFEFNGELCERIKQTVLSFAKDKEEQIKKELEKL